MTSVHVFILILLLLLANYVAARTTEVTNNKEHSEDQGKNSHITADKTGDLNARQLGDLNARHVGDLNAAEKEDVDQLVAHLLPRYIHRARCEAKCSAASTSEARGRCLEVCSMPRRPDGLCAYAWLCGEGCTLACALQETTSAASAISSENIRQMGCRGEIVWAPSNEEEKMLRYIVAGRDGAGMWNVIESLSQESSILLSKADRDRYDQLAVLTVGSGGVIDTKIVHLTQAIDVSCEDAFWSKWTVFSVPSTLSWILFAISLLVFVAAMICCCFMLRMPRNFCRTEKKERHSKTVLLPLNSPGGEIELQPMCATH
jgi:hypothetical protein